MIVSELIARLGLDVDGTGFQKAEAMLAGLRNSLFAFGTAAAAAAAVGVVAITKGFANAGDEARKLAQKTGVDSIALQELGYAAQLADVSTEQLALGLKHLAKTGVKDVRREVLRLADQFKAMPDDGEKVALAIKKFGRAGAQLIPLLNGGSEEIAKLAAEAHELGIVIGEEDQKAAEEFNDSVTRLGKAFVGLRNDLGRALLPYLAKLVERMRAGVKAFRAWWKAADGIVQQIRRDFIPLLKGAAIILAGVLLSALIANASAAAAAAGWYVALSVAAIRAGIAAAAAWVKAALPVIVLTGLVAALLLLLDDVRGFFAGEDSFIGSYGVQWTKFLDRILADRTEDFWLLRALKAVGRFLTDIGGHLDALEKKFAGTSFGRWVNQTNTDIRERAARGQLTEYEKANGLGGYVAPPPPSLFGAKPAAPSVPTVYGPTKPGAGPIVNAPITVNAAPGMDAKAVANEVNRTLEERLQTVWREAATGAQ